MATPETVPGWKRMLFKGNKVWVSTGTANRPQVKDGKVLIKYNLKQEYEYWVNETALHELTAENWKDARHARKKKKNSSAKKSNDPSKPLFDDKDSILVYTDGACSGNPGPAGIGVVLRYKDNLKEISRDIGRATNNVAELEAIRVGLAAIKSRDLPVKVFTDSAYAYGLLVKGWQAKKNQELVEEILTLIKKFDKLQFVKVKGHAGIPDNELADQLATSAIGYEK